MFSSLTDSDVLNERVSTIKDCKDLLACLREVRLFDANNLIYLPILVKLCLGEDHKSWKLLEDFEKASLTSPLYPSEIKMDPCKLYN